MFVVLLFAIVSTLFIKLKFVAILSAFSVASVFTVAIFSSVIISCAFCDASKYS
jgi:hypothetical protein